MKACCVKKALCLLFLLGAFKAAYAQSREDIIIGIQTTGGTPNQQDYFLHNFTVETMAAGYTVVENPQDADYTLNLEIKRNNNGTGQAPAPGEREFVLGIHLLKNDDNSEIVYFEFAFTELVEMYEYNLYLLYNALANIPLTKVVDARAPEPEKWLWIGLRGGASFRFYERPIDSTFVDNEGVISFNNFNAALQAFVHILPWLDVQAEVNFTTDYAPFIEQWGSGEKTRPFKSQSLMFPLLARFNIRKGPLMAGVLGGLYFFLPLGQMENDVAGRPSFNGSFDYKMDLPIGYTAGFNIGMKLGPGYLFLDARWAADLGALETASGENIYSRSMIMLNIGYEMGFFPKKPKEK